ncbi:ABC transporter substrate-binding protein [Bradyrhizobium tropiciagri]|uniref:ABC transporter substrate-binding protein n=1 Tax=Bradyrhizobium tropiciagri TaxID=312253 RepID=UPI001BA500E8|nr:ABC transporter substrate-binding protein [Bradyrhizobium tropiciagri]MBR0896719.1 ABC transporter substrate-binding protein [Bradyrhizobium tropiciagri]
MRKASTAAVSAAAIAWFLMVMPPAFADIKIGIIASGSGPVASLGRPQMESIPFLPSEIAGQKVSYIALDDESDATKSAQNARKLIFEEKVDVLIGSSGTPSSLPLIDIAAEAKIPLLTLAGSDVMIEPMDDKRRWVFKVVPKDSLMAGAIANYIARKGVKRLGYIGFSDGYGEGYYNQLAKLAPGLGIELTTHEVFARSDASVTGQVLKILATKPDAVFVAAAGSPGVVPQRALRSRGFTGPIFQTHGIAGQDFLTLGGKDVEGATFAGEAFIVADDLVPSSPFRAATDDFISRWKDKFGKAPPIFAAHVIDSVALVQRAALPAIKSGQPGTAEFRAALRDEIEKVRDLFLNNGLSNMSPTDHNGYDGRSAFIISVREGRYRLEEAGR